MHPVVGGLLRRPSTEQQPSQSIGAFDVAQAQGWISGKRSGSTGEKSHTKLIDFGRRHFVRSVRKSTLRT
jgi:hypothetical protein